MINSGLPLTDSLNILQKQTEKEQFREVIGQLAEDIQGGGTFADAVSKHEDIFSLAYVNVVRAGESSGTLDTVLLNLAYTLEKYREFQYKINNFFFSLCFGFSIFFFFFFFFPHLSDYLSKLFFISLLLKNIERIGKW